MSVQRGCIYRARFPTLSAERPALVVSSDLVSQYLKPVVVQVTSRERVRTLPTFVRLAAGEGGLIRDSFALCHEIHTLDSDLLSDEPLGPRIPLMRLVEVEQAIRRALDLELAA